MSYTAAGSSWETMKVGLQSHVVTASTQALTRVQESHHLPGLGQLLAPSWGGRAEGAQGWRGARWSYRAQPCISSLIPHCLTLLTYLCVGCVNRWFSKGQVGNISMTWANTSKGKVLWVFYLLLTLCQPVQKAASAFILGHKAPSFKENIQCSQIPSHCRNNVLQAKANCSAELWSCTATHSLSLHP